MTPPDRALISELADDFGWLERHAHKRPNRSDSAVPLRFAAALVRNVIGPVLASRPAEPLHIAVVGGAGTGKSTVANLLTGTTSAETNPQAGFTRHPVAYTLSETAADWASQDDLLGPLKRLTAPGPSNLDEDYYQIRHLPSGDATKILEHFVVWDCPDMTTWAAEGYAPRLLEVAGLADVIVYVASDERYNDAAPTRYLKMFLEAGKPIIAVLTKMAADQADPLIAHFKKTVLGALPRGRVAVLSVPFLTSDELAEPAAQAAKYRIPLLNQLTVLGEDAAMLRRQSAAVAVRNLKRNADALLAVARDDVAALDDWARLIDRGRGEFLDRYRREYLTGAKFHRFDEALVKLIDLLELPGVGKFISSTLNVVRTPYRLLKGLVVKILGTSNASTIPEQPVLDGAFAAWSDQIRAYSLAAEHNHDLWEQVVRGFENGLGKQMAGQYQAGLANFQASQTAEIDATARAIYEDLEKSPGTLNAFRAGKLAMDVGAIGASFLMGGWSLHDVILVPLAAAMSQQLVEWAGAGYVEIQKEKARQRQQQLVAHNIADPIDEMLTKWPTTGGTEYARLQLALNRIPASLNRLAEVLPTS